MSKLTDFLAAHPPDVRLPLHEDLLTFEGVDTAVGQTGTFAPVSITNLRGRSGLATGHQLDGSGAWEPSVTVDQCIAMVLEVGASYDGATFAGLYSNGDTSNSIALIVDNFNLILRSAVSSQGATLVEYEIPGPGTYLIGARWDASTDAELYLDGVQVDSITGATALVNATEDPRVGGADTRYPGNTASTPTEIDGLGLRIAEFMTWNTSNSLTAQDHADLYDALFVAPTLPFEFVSSTPTITVAASPLDPVDDIAIIEALESEVVRPIRWVDIYDNDNTTILHSKVAVETGSVSVDMERDERRNFSVTFSDEEEVLGYGPEDFWYDKFLRPYRGIEFADGSQWVTPLGQFMPDSITRPYFPRKLTVNCRDLTKKLLLNKFAQTTTFSAGTNVATAISAIASNAGVTDQTFSTVSDTLPEDFTCDIGSPRWNAMKDMANSIGYELFFNAWGSLVFRPYVDPTTAVVAHTFQDGEASNLATYDRSTNDSRLFNDIIVYGSTTETASYWGRAQNTDANSPTRIAKVGQRTKTFGFQSLASSAKAQSIAESFLKVSGLEQYDINFTGLVLPWLDVGEAIEFNVSTSSPSDPTRFLLATLTIPLTLEAMSANSRRVINVG